MPTPPERGGEGAKDRATPGTGLPHDDADALAAIVESSDDAIYSKDAAARISSWNPAAERLYGYSANEAVGRPVSLIIPEDKQGEDLIILERVLGGERIRHFETTRRRKDGTMIEVSISVSPVHSPDGQIVEAAIIARDVTEQRRLQKELDQAREERADASRKQAMDLNDNVVQGLAIAKMALETGKQQQGLEAIEATLKQAQGIVTRLLEEHWVDEPPRMGDLTRDEPARLWEETPSSD